MKKIIDVKEALLPKLKLLAAIENTSVKKLMENAIEWYVLQKQKERMQGMGNNEKEDLGLLLLMQQASITETVGVEELFKPVEK